MSLAAGTRLGPYEIASPLGAGGMGEVYRAHDARLRRDVAIKILPAAFAQDSERLARFEREAQALAALNHPNIAAIYGFEESALVMELVEGQTLAERLASGAIRLEEALAIARQIAAALEAAHEKGIIHRDLKPANIKLTPDGKVKVLDFGLAKAFDESAPASATALANSPTITLEQTRAGVILGTAAYMSPEQARGKPVDKRADIWAFGVIFLEMLTGRTLFEGETVSDTLAGVLRADIDWQSLPAGTPTAVQRLIARCLERDLKRRLRDIGDAWIEVDAAVALARPPARPLPWVALAAALLAGAAGIAWGLFHKPATSAHPVVRWTYSLDSPVYFLGLSRDGSRLAFMNINQEFAIMVRMMDQLGARLLPGTENSYLPTFSPDGEWIAYINDPSNPTLKKIPAMGGVAVSLCEARGNPAGLAWGDDGKIVFGGSKGLFRVPDSGGAAEQLTTVNTGKQETAHQFPNVLPGGRAILYSIASGQSSRVAVLDLKSRASRVLVENASNPRYLPSGHLIYYRAGTLFAAPFHLSSLTIAGPEAPAVDKVSSIFTDVEGGDFSVSETGTLVYVSGSAASGKTVLSWADRKVATQPITDQQYWGTGRLSPDGLRIANSIRAAKSEDVWVYDVARRIPTRLTFEGASYFPIWSPDGRAICFAGARGDQHGLYRIAADGSGKAELLLTADASATPSSWSPDGRTLIYSEVGADKKRHLFSVTLPGGKPARIHDTDSSEPNGEISPDGHWLAYASTDSGAEEIYVQPFPGPGGKVRISTQGGQMPRWSHDGKELFYWNIGAQREAIAVDVQPGPVFRAGAPQDLFKLVPGTTWDVAPDGKHFLVEMPLAVTAGSSQIYGVDNWFDELRRLAPVKQ